MSQFLPIKYKTAGDMANAFAQNDPSAIIENTAFNNYAKNKNISLDSLNDTSPLFLEFVKYEESLTSGDFVIANQLVPKLAIYGGAGLVLFLILKK